MNKPINRQLRKRFPSYLLLIIFLISITSITIFGAHKTSGCYPILRTGVNSRALAMGGSYVAISNDYSSPYWNPAGITKAGQAYLGGMNLDRFGLGLNFNYISAGISLTSPPLNKYLGSFDLKTFPVEDFSAAGTYMGFASELQAVDAAGEKTNLITYRENLFIATAGIRLHHLGSIGFSVKNYRLRAPNCDASSGDATANGFGLDIGYQVEPRKNLVFGAAMFDIGDSTIEWVNTSTEPENAVPTRFSTGLAYTLPVEIPLASDPEPSEITVSGQYTTSQEMDKFSGGMECRVWLFSLRAGVIRRDECDFQLTAGAGVNTGLFTLDTAWLQNNSLKAENATDTAVLSIEFRF